MTDTIVLLVPTSDQEHDRLDALLGMKWWGGSYPTLLRAAQAYALHLQGRAGRCTWINCWWGDLPAGMVRIVAWIDLGVVVIPTADDRSTKTVDLPGDAWLIMYDVQLKSGDES